MSSDGGAPADARLLHLRAVRDEPLPFSLPEVGEEELAGLRRVVESRWLTTGEVTAEFERRFSAAVGARHALALSSCTAAMHLGLEGVGVRRDDFVVTSVYTFAATAEVIRYFDAIPVFVDIDPVTCNLDVGHVERVLAGLAEGNPSVLPPRLRHLPPGPASAVLPVHVAGHPCELDPLRTLCRRFGTALIEDAAHAFPAAYRQRAVGSGPGEGVRWAACFSFYATKPITTGEGGMLVTDDEELADRCRMMSLHGLSKGAYERYTELGSWKYDIAAPGFKYNMPDLSAAIGLAQLEKAESMRARRRAIAHRYTEAFGRHPALEAPTEGSQVEHAWHLYMLRLCSEHLTCSRDRFIDELRRSGIGTSVHFIPLHLHSYYRTLYGYQPEDFPVARREYEREVSLPIYSSMTAQDIDDVVRAVSDIVERHSV